MPWLIGLAAAFLAIGGAGAVALSQEEHDYVLAAMLCQAPVYAGAAWLVLRRPAGAFGGTAIAIMIGTAIVSRAVILPMPPVSTDIYRYIWDGRVQAAGTNPYRYVPADARLAGLRDRDIFPYINRVDTATTIYPPAAQMLFWAVTRVSERVWAMKAALVLFEGLTVLGLIGLMRRRGIPPIRLLLYLWHPLPIWEIAGSGHVDAAATGLMVVAILAADRDRQGLSGALLALGAGVKYFPAFVAPALYRRFGWRMPAAFAAILVLLYLPYLGAGLGVLGYLPGYAEEEGLAGGGGVFWLKLVAFVAPAAAAALAKPYLAAGALGLILFGLVVVARRPPEQVPVWAAQALLVAFVVVVTPHYPWYLISLVPLLCVVPSVSVAYLTLMGPILYGTIWPFNFTASQVAIYLPFVALAWFDIRRRRRPPHEVSA